MERMKTDQAAWNVYRVRVWTGLVLALMLALADLWTGMHLGTGASLTCGQRLTEVGAELCDVIR